MNKTPIRDRLLARLRVDLDGPIGPDESIPAGLDLDHLCRVGTSRGALVSGA